MIFSAYLPHGACTTGGDSESAILISKRIRENRRELQRPETYFPVMKKVLPELIDISREDASSGWDGYAAEPIGIETFLHAISFAQSLLDTVPPPTVGAEPDGNITFEWYRSKNRVLSVSISPDGDLHYAALIGPNQSYGTEKFLGDVPKTILDLIRRVRAA